jgi:hypothetical protein
MFLILKEIIFIQEYLSIIDHANKFVRTDLIELIVGCEDYFLDKIYYFSKDIFHFDTKWI